MKLKFALFVLAAASSGLAFSFHSILARLGLAKNRIPPFIYSLGHLYIFENQDAIESLVDPKQAFCDRHSNQRALIPPIPDDLFKKLSLDDENWGHTSTLLSGILDCPLALETLERLQVKVFMPFSKETEPPANVLSLFTQLFREAVQIKTLVWMDPYPDLPGDRPISVLHSHLREQNLHLPSITKMMLGPNAEFFVSTAPNLQSLSFAQDFSWTRGGFRGRSRNVDGPQRRLIRSLASAKQLKEVGLDADLNLDLITELQEAAPGVKKLKLNGDLGADGQHYGSAGVDNFKKALSPLAKLENLVELQLPHVSALGISANSQPSFRCGNAYFGIDGTKHGRVESLGYVRDMEEIAPTIIQALPRLSKICLGQNCANIRQGKAVDWPWTGRLKDYILDRWPRLDGNDIVPDNQVKEDPNSPVLHSWEEDEAWFQSAHGKFPPAVVEGDFPPGCDDFEDYQHDEL